MGAVKGAILALLDEAYRKRDRVGMLAFRGDSTIDPPMTRSLTPLPKNASRPPHGRGDPAGARFEQGARNAPSKGASSTGRRQVFGPGVRLPRQSRVGAATRWRML